MAEPSRDAAPGPTRLEPSGGRAHRVESPFRWPERVDREWAWGGATGAGVRVCILDSGVELDHPLVGERRAAPWPCRSTRTASAQSTTTPKATSADTARPAPAIVRALAPDCEIVSVRVLGAGYKGSGPVLLAGLRWSIEQGFDVVNMSLSTTKSQFAARPARARRHAPTSAARCSSRRRTTCPWRAIRGASRP